jgi:site-specific DNA-methyltransferase (adenine-specific)
MEMNKFHLIDVIEGLKSLDNEIADIIIIDPPYNINKDFGECKDNMSIIEYVNWSKEWMNESLRVLKPTGSMYIYGYSEVLAHLSVALYPIKHRWLIWHYTNKTVPSLKNMWQRSHESILYVWKDKPVFNVDDIRTPYTDTFLKNSAGKIRPKGRSRFDGNKDTVYNANEKGALPRDVFTDISSLAGGLGGKERYFLYEDKVYPSKMWKNFPEKDCIKHPTQKPSRLTERLILSSKPEKDGLLVIPFGGSGSEGVVAKKLGLSFIGFDNNSDYIKLSNGAVEIYDSIF